MRAHGVLGASISLDSTDRVKHDAFRHLAGAWDGAVRATRVLTDAGLDFSLHMSVTCWNVAEVPAMIDLAEELGAKVLNFFFLVRTGRGRDLTDIDAAAYERILTYLARTQGVGTEPPSFVKRMLGMGGGSGEKFEDPWSVPVGRADGLLIRAKCAPHFRRVLYEMNPSSPLLRNYAHGSCPAGKYYCRITPDGDVTPCPYMPVTAGNVRERSFADLWRAAPVFGDLRDPKLGGRCGVCEFAKICGGCRCRAYATYGDYLAEDPACAYQPGAHGGELIDLPASLTFGLSVDYELVWDAEARGRLERWILSRADFARILTALMALRAWHVLRVALRPETASVPAPWGGELTFRVGAIVFLVVTAGALVLVGRAAWDREAA